ncbi:hypothetical protein K1719_041492 [Acacia pycnantha]|nr:hypothetical protein K1719_041492 [Acacia pycnantha]
MAAASGLMFGNNDGFSIIVSKPRCWSHRSSIAAIKVAALCGSLRKGSFHRGLIRSDRSNRVEQRRH